MVGCASSSYGCTWGVGRTLKKVKMLLVIVSRATCLFRALPTSRVLSQHPACSPNIPRALPISCVLSQHPACTSNLVFLKIDFPNLPYLQQAVKTSVESVSFHFATDFVDFGNSQSFVQSPVSVAAMLLF